MKYRKKPVIVEAIRWTGINSDEIEDFVGYHLNRWIISDSAYQAGVAAPVVGIDIPTLEGDMTATSGDYIIKGVKGECYPCKPDIFETTYEEVGEE